MEERDGAQRFTVLGRFPPFMRGVDRNGPKSLVCVGGVLRMQERRPVERSPFFIDAARVHITESEKNQKGDAT